MGDRSPLIFERGNTVVRTIDWDGSDGYPIDLTGFTAKFIIVVGDITLVLTPGSGLEIDEDEGRVTITASASQTALFVEQFGSWSLTLTSGGGTVTTIAEGYVFVSTYAS